MYQAVTSTRKIQRLKSRIRLIEGGTAASKTVSTILILINLAQTDERPTLTSIVSESLPHLKRGAMRDFLDIMRTHNYYDEARWNRTDYIYTFETGSQIEFFPADQPDKLRGPRRDRLYINEGNNIAQSVFDQLEPRTRETVWIDWNPTHEFWAYELLSTRDDVEIINLTYKDNEALDEQFIQAIEARRHNKNWWRVFGEGKMGQKEGLVYTDWGIIDEIPKEARLEIRGLDFGYTNNPSALISIYKWNDKYIIDEEFYKVGLKNREIAEFIKGLNEQCLVVADSAEPKSIDEISDYGIDIIGARKGRDSVNFGINLVQDQKILVTKRSTNIIKEKRNYMWKTDRNGNPLNVPEKAYDHGQDAERYAFMELLDSQIMDEDDFDVL